MRQLKLFKISLALGAPSRQGQNGSKEWIDGIVDYDQKRH